MPSHGDWHQVLPQVCPLSFEILFASKTFLILYQKVAKTN